MLMRLTLTNSIGFMPSQASRPAARSRSWQTRQWRERRRSKLQSAAGARRCVVQSGVCGEANGGCAKARPAGELHPLDREI